MKKITKIISGAAIFAVAGIAVAAPSATTFAAVSGGATQQVQVVVPSSLTLTGNTTVNGSTTGTLAAANITTLGQASWNGALGSNSGNHTGTATNSLTISTNSSNGYTVSVAMDSVAMGDPVGKATSANLTNGGGTGTATGDFTGTSGVAITAGTATSGATSNWYYDGGNATVSGGALMKTVSAPTAVSNTVQTSVAQSNTVSSAAGDTITPAYGAYISSNQAAGTYNNTVLYTVVTSM